MRKFVTNLVPLLVACETLASYLIKLHFTHLYNVDNTLPSRVTVRIK